MSDQQHLYLVDGSSYIFRAYHRLPPLTDPQGTPVGAVYGYTTMLWKLADDLDQADGPTHLAVILDASGRSFRNEIYPEYKANRPPAPEDLVPQFPLIRDATRAFSLPCIEIEGLEADDLIASYARAAQAQGWNVTIVSSDKDLMQLVGERDGARIDMLDTMKSQRIYVEEVEEKFGVKPELVGDVLALMGDSVDNVPGIYGIGPKTASKLIAEHGSLTAALDSAPDMKKSKLKERLLDHREDAELSRILVELKQDCDLPEALDSFKLDGVPPDPLAAFSRSTASLRCSAGLVLAREAPKGPTISTRRSARSKATQAQRMATASRSPKCRLSITLHTRQCRRWSGSKRGLPARWVRKRSRSIPKPARSTRCRPTSSVSVSL